MKRTPLLATLALLAAGSLAACGSSDDALDSGTDSGSGSSKTLVIGSANFPESALLAEIYAEALDAKGVDTDTKLNIGAREAYIKGLQDGSVDVFPEYTGNLRLYFNDKATASDPDGVYQELKDALPDGLTVLDFAEAQDKDAVAVTKATADKYSLTAIGDLAPVASKLVLGGPPEWKTRSTGLPGLKKIYGLTFKDFSELDAGGPLTLKALQDGRIQAGNLFTTDPALATGDIVALQDPDNLFAAQNIVPLLRTDAVSDKVTSTLNAVSAALDTDTLAALVARVVTDKEDPEDVAASFLSDNSLD